MLLHTEASQLADLAWSSHHHTHQGSCNSPAPPAMPSFWLELMWECTTSSSTMIPRRCASSMRACDGGGWWRRYQGSMVGPALSWSSYILQVI